MPPCATSAFSDVTAVRTKMPRLVWAARNGAFGCWAISSRRSDSMPLNNRSAISLW